MIEELRFLEKLVELLDVRAAVAVMFRVAEILAVDNDALDIG